MRVGVICLSEECIAPLGLRVIRLNKEWRQVFLIMHYTSLAHAAPLYDSLSLLHHLAKEKKQEEIQV